MNVTPWYNFVYLGILSLTVLVTAVAVATRARLDGRAEVGMVTFVVANALVVCPIYILGFTNRLSARNLGAFSLILDLTLLAFMRSTTTLKAIVAEVDGFFRLPFDALTNCYRERSIVTVPVVLSGLAVVWATIQAWFAPTWRGWDPVWYHETLVGFAIQNHGFRVIDLPMELQKINGYPRLCEMTHLWFVIFTDRRLLDVTNALISPALMLGTYGLCRRFSTDRVVPIGFATALFLMPAGLIIIQSTYVDAHVAAFVIVAAYFCTRTPFRLRDALITTLALTLAIGAKPQALFPVAALSTIGATRLLYHHFANRRAATFGTLAIALTSLAGMFSCIYVRNWLYFGNPFWPDLKYDNERWNIHWRGVYEWGSGKSDLGYNRLDMNLPWDQLLDWMLEIPYRREVQHYQEVYDYGFSIGWIIAPLGCISLVVLFAVMSRSFLRRLTHRGSASIAQRHFTALQIALVLVVTLRWSPALWASRYNIALLALAFALISWFGTFWPRLVKETAAMVALGSIISLFWYTRWSGPQSFRWWLRPKELIQLAHIPYPEREITDMNATISRDLWRVNGAPVVPEYGRARERLFGPESTVAFSDNFGHFVSLFWNNRFENTLRYFPAGPDLLKRVEDSGADFFFCEYTDPVCHQVAAPGSAWREIGSPHIDRYGSMFRRVR